jgi:hypothetical protein
MPTMKHPTFDDVTETVEDDAVQDWKDAGWLPADSDDAKDRASIDAGIATDAESSDSASTGTATSSSARRRATGSSAHSTA